MSLIEKMLKGIQPGKNIKLTHINGSTIEGVVIANEDGEIAIKSDRMVVMAYSQITYFEEAGENLSAAKKSEATFLTSPAGPDIPNILAKITPENYEITPEKIKNLFNSLDRDARKITAPSYNSLLSGIKAHDNSKIDEASKKLNKIVINSDKLMYDAKTNFFLAHIMAYAGQPEEAAEAFYVSRNFREAYLSFYSLKEYFYSAAAAALYISKSEDTVHLSEAYFVLASSSVNCYDMYGIFYVYNAHENRRIVSGTDYIKAVMKYIAESGAINCGPLNPNDPADCISKLKTVSFNQDVSKEIEFFDDKYSSIPIIEKNNEDKKAEEKIEAVQKTYSGEIIRNKWYDNRGTIKCDEDGKEYNYVFEELPDERLKETLSKFIGGDFRPISVTFSLIKDKAVDVKYKRPAFAKRDDWYGSENRPYVDKANYMFTFKNYNKAIDIYSQVLESEETDNNKLVEAVVGLLKCKLSLANAKMDETYTDEAVDIIEKYGSRINCDNRVYRTFADVYNRKGMYRKAADCLEKVLDNLPREKNSTRLDYFIRIGGVLLKLKDYSGAINYYQKWLEEFVPSKYDKDNPTMKNYVYPGLAESYFYLGDLVSAKKYASLSRDNAKCIAVMEMIREQRNRPKREKEEVPAENETEAPEKPVKETISKREPLVENEKPLEELYALYEDKDGFEALGRTTEDIIETAFSFGSGKEYCTLTYLKAAALLNGDLNPVYRLASFAYDDPSEEKYYGSTEISMAYKAAEYIIPEECGGFLLSAVIRALFNSDNTRDFDIINVCARVKEKKIKIAESVPSIYEFLDLLCEFRNKTGMGMENQAALILDSQENSARAKKIIEEAVEFKKTTLDSCESKEKVERIRHTRRFIFVEKSELRKCFDAVCDNNVSEADNVAEVITEKFLKKESEFSARSIDIRKIDDYIDVYWKEAGNYLEDRGKLIDKSSNLMSGRRTNIIKIAERMLVFIIDWVNCVRADNNFSKDDYSIQIFKEMKDDVIKLCGAAAESCGQVLEEENCSIGAESVYYTLSEILKKLKGEYSPLNKKYFFMPFLLSGDIVLGNDFIPEINSTFCFLKDFNVLSRIERHAASDFGNEAYETRIDEILSDDMTKSNFRSAALIKEYAKDKGITSITDNNTLKSMDRFVTHSGRRVKLLYNNFKLDIVMAENYGRISSSSSVKDRINECIDSWYNISMKTKDFGFFTILLEAIDRKIHNDAEAYGEVLTAQTEKIFENYEPSPNSYTKQDVISFINDQNYTVAENMINCILRGDVTQPKDFAMEPYSYLKGFLDEYRHNYSIVTDNSVTLVQSIRQYIRNSIAKYRRGADSLIESWPTGNNISTDKVTVLLNRLGWENITVTRVPNSKDNIFMVRKEKTHGRVNYSLPVPAFSSCAETEGFRVAVLYGTYDSSSLISKFRDLNTESLHTIVFLDYSLTEPERRLLAREIKQEQSFAKTFIVIDRVLLFYLAVHYAGHTVNKMLMATAFPFAYYQPFVSESRIEMPPELFTGRVNELREIEAADGVNIIYGGRQLGKSALLRRARNDIDGNNLGDRAIVIDIYQKDYTEAAQYVSRELINAGILDKDCECDDWEILADNIRERLAREGAERINYLLLMLDEADTFIESCKAVDYKPISALKNLLSVRFKFVIAGLHNIMKYDRASSLSNNSIIPHLKSIVIGPFKTPEGTELLTHTLGYLGVIFPDKSMISLILATTNYFPGLIQLYCEKLLEAMKNENYAYYQESNTPPYRVSEKHIKAVLKSRDFIDEIRHKLEMTLLLDQNQGGYYMVIPLLLAYLNDKKPSEIGYTWEEIKSAAEEQSISRITELNSDKAGELMNELCALNVLRENGHYYTFSSKNFCELLGTGQDVANKLADYID